MAVGQRRTQELHFLSFEVVGVLWQPPYPALCLLTPLASSVLFFRQFAFILIGCDKNAPFDFRIGFFATGVKAKKM